MPAVVTTHFRNFIAEQFYESFSEAAPTNLYLFIGRVSAWTDDDNPPSPVDNVQNTDYNVWKEMIALKKMVQTDISYVAPRTNWANNTFIVQYDSSVDVSGNSFFVVTDNDQVYKCLYNNRGANSTVKPTGTSTSVTQTSDGYRWKYMYTMSPPDKLKYYTSTYMPAKTLAADDGSVQWDVQQAAVNGAIDVIQVSANGTGYILATNTFSSVTNTSQMVLATGSSGADGTYTNSAVFILSGKGAGQLSNITNYAASTRTITISPSFTVAPNTSSTYYVSPKVIITGDGTNAKGYANVSAGQLKHINMITGGTNYSNSTVTVLRQGNTTNYGTGATAYPVLAPPNGHGYDPVNELYAFNVMVVGALNGGVANGTFGTNNDFRVIGLLKDPLTAAGAVANASVYDQTHRITVVAASGNYTLDEEVTDGEGGAGVVVDWTSSNGHLKLLSTSINTIQSAKTLTGGNSAVTSTSNVVTTGDLQIGSGKVIYVDNRKPVQRATNQIEDIKFVVTF
jgi:hypothetical protein